MTPALAQSMETGIRLMSSRAARSSAASAAAAFAASRPSRQAFRRAICSASADSSTVMKAPLPAVSGETSVSL
ncbi:MAG: hypothetical protein WDM81_00545 [Rhizomicrobium sp.]